MKRILKDSKSNGKRVVLDKALCKRCYIDNYADSMNAEWSYHNSMGAWPSPEEAWDEEKVAVCVASFWHYGKPSIYEAPPKWCPRIFEHGVSVARREG